MRLMRSYYLLALLKISHWCADQADEIFDQINEERRLKELNRRHF
ncbi:hypothetical protein [Phyllobacterium sp. CL33Tsu]|nr:hypothetical protein [Phyllobacterium sp. CL33Tsu]